MIDLTYLNEILLKATFNAWKDIEQLTLGDFKIGRDFKPTGQLIGNLLHILIPKHMELLDKDFQIGTKKEDKDILWNKHSDFAIEIKTSSSKSGVYGNRSYPKGDNIKDKNSYYLIINYTNFDENANGYIHSIKVGYIRKEDWKAQDSETGQQSYLKDKSILRTIYKK